MMNLTMRYWSQSLIGVWLISLSGFVAADAQLTVITLNHRPAEQLLPTLKPLIRQGDYLTGLNDKLFLRTDPATLSAVRQIVEELDRQPITLLIMVRQESQQNYKASRVTGNIIVRGGNGEIKIGDSDASLSTNRQRHENDIDGAVSATTLSTRDRNSSDQQVTVAEGFEAQFYVGQQIPVGGYQQGYYGLPQPTVSYKSAATGFTVLARLNGDQVNLHIRPRKENFTGGDYLETQQLETTVAAKLGEWTQIGSITDGSSRSGDDILSRTNHHRNQFQSIIIKVEKVDALQ